MKQKCAKKNEMKTKMLLKSLTHGKAAKDRKMEKFSVAKQITASFSFLMRLFHHSK